MDNTEFKKIIQKITSKYGFIYCKKNYYCHTHKIIIDKLYKDILEGKYLNTDRHFIIPLTKVQKYKLNKKNIEHIFLEDI